MITLDLPLIWAGLIATAVLLYVLLDGFDLGVGVLFPFVSDHERDVMTASIAPVWDGNETWLVLGGGGLFAAFPLAYAVIMPALYIPITLMLIALIFRGVAFEFRAHGRKRGKVFWTRAFAGGSILAVISQGLVLGAFVQGIQVEGRSFAGGAFDWLTPFSLLTAAALTAGYTLLGATWLIIKTDGALQEKARRWTRTLTILVAVGIAAVSLATLSVNPHVAARWGVSITSIAWDQFLPLVPVPLAGGVALVTLFFTAANKDRAVFPYLLAAITFLSGYTGLALSIAPDIVPYDITLWEAAAKDNALLLMLFGVVALLPVILGYTAYVYWVFRGKAEVEHGYH
jgi:cytochrome d ubiquinol oxidase subunit II